MAVLRITELEVWLVYRASENRMRQRNDGVGAGGKSDPGAGVVPAAGAGPLAIGASSPSSG